MARDEANQNEHAATIGGIEMVLYERECFEWLIGSCTLGSFTGAEAVISNDLGQKRKEISYRFSPDRFEINATLALRPGPNQIRVRLYGNGKDAEGTIDLNLDGRSHISNGVEFMLEGESKTVANSDLDGISRVVLEMNPLLEAPVNKIYVLDWEHPWGAVAYVLDRDECNAVYPRVELSRFNFKNPPRDPNAVAWHELAHIFYENLAGTLKEYLENNAWRKYGKEFVPLFNQAVALSIRTGGDEYMRPWADIRKNSVMRLFCSHLYRGLDMSGPQAHHGELFAYGAEVLRYFPEEFKDRLSQLGTQEERDLAVQIASKIASVYAPHFPGFREFIK